VNTRISSSGIVISSEVELPVSKSMMNRFLTLTLLAKGELPQTSSNFPDDINFYIDMLSNSRPELKCGDAGTAMRFGTALFSSKEGNWILRGSERMHERPIGILVEALQTLGADISYLGQTGYPPISINGRKLKGGHIDVPADVSSQFISALLMIAPTCDEGLTISTVGKVISQPYIDLTIGMMKKMNVDVEQSGGEYKISPQSYNYRDMEIEKDWSAASFMYEICSLAQSCEIQLPGLRKNSLQGDKRCAELYGKLGVESSFNEEGLIISKASNLFIEKMLKVDFTDIPDLFQPFSMSCAALDIELEATGLFNLHLKESNRIEATGYNLNQLGCDFEVNNNNAIIKPAKKLNSKPRFKSFNDHRMAMSLAPLAIVTDEIIIDNMLVVGKSFPEYNKELLKLGFGLHEID